MSISTIYPISTRFLTLESAIASCRTAAGENGYGLRLSTKKTNKQGVITCRKLRCDRSGNEDSTSNGSRHSGSLRCNCQFVLRIFLSGNEYLIDASYSTHNHAPSISANGHPSVTHITDIEKEKIGRQAKLGTRPRTILAELKQQGSNATARGIYNCLAKHRKLQLGGQTSICALLSLLCGEGESDSREGEQDWWFDFSVDTEDCLNRLFFQHKTSIVLLRQFYEVVIMDCTYSTNRFGMPLLHIVGCTNINTTFEVGYAFLSRETEEDYVWAIDVLRKILSENNIPEPRVIVTDRELALMNAIDRVLINSKNILCAWHIKMALKSYLAKALDSDSAKDFTEDFMKVWNASTTVEFSEQWNHCCTKWSSIPPNGEKILNYLENTWLPYADRFANCYISKHLHLGHLTSGKAEGAHHYIKMFISDSTGDLFTVVKRIRLALGQQYRRYQDLLHQQQVKGVMRGQFYREVNTTVCRHALKLVETQVGFLEKHKSRLQTFGIPIPECSCNFTLSLGVPCYHAIKEKLDSNQRLDLADFNRHWYLTPTANIIELLQNENGSTETK